METPNINKSKNIKELTIKEIKTICRPSKRITRIPLVIYSKLTIYFSYLFLRLGISANSITFFWVALATISTFFLWKGTYLYTLIGILLYEFALFIDMTDGEVARFYEWKTGKKATLLDSYLDTVAHYLHRGLILLGLGIGAWNRFDNIYWFYLGIAVALIVTWDNMFKLKELEVLVYKNRAEKLEEEKNTLWNLQPGLRGKIMMFFKPDILSIFLFSAILNITHLILILYLIGAPILLMRSFIQGCQRMNKIQRS